MSIPPFDVSLKHGFNFVQQFVDAGRKLATQAELRQLMEDVCAALGYRYFALIWHDDLMTDKQGRILLHSYPEVWADYFIRQRLYRHDPVLRGCLAHSAAFLWSDLIHQPWFNARHRDIFEMAARAGVVDGMTIPGGVRGERAGSCSFAGPRFEMNSDQLIFGQMVGAFAYEAARRVFRSAPVPGRPRRHLYPRHRDCIVLAGLGKTNSEIADVLGIKIKTVAGYMAETFETYGVFSRAQAVIAAILDGEISLIELSPPTPVI
jgi:LuxR family quorum-sensing system transcriptional regulator CciR